MNVKERGIKMANIYRVDFGDCGWYVYNHKTFWRLKLFTTRQQARDYAKIKNNKEVRVTKKFIDDLKKGII